MRQKGEETKFILSDVFIIVGHHVAFFSVFYKTRFGDVLGRFFPPRSLSLLEFVFDIKRYIPTLVYIYIYTPKFIGDCIRDFSFFKLNAGFRGIGTFLLSSVSFPPLLPWSTLF